MKIGVLDWGIGGAGFLKMLAAHRPNVATLYFSDSGFTPYGKVPRAALAKRVGQVLNHLRGHGVTHVVVACNAASTVLGDLSDAVWPKERITGVIEPALTALARGRRQILGVVGGNRTIRAGVYGRHLRAYGHEIRQRVAQPLSALVEAGITSGPKVDAVLTEVLRPLKGVDRLVLACTHYPAAAAAFRAHLPGVELMDPVDATWDLVVRQWVGRSGARKVETTVALTTGDAKVMSDAAKRAFGVRFAKIQTVRL